MRKRSGIALVIAMLLSSLLVMLAGAFFQINRGNLMTGSIAFKQRKALLAAQSGIAWVRAKLEAGQDYCKTEFPVEKTLFARDMRIVELEGQRTVSGTFTTELDRQDQAFNITIVNNLKSAATTGQTYAGHYAPPDSVHLHAEGFCAGFRSAIDVVFAGEPLYDSSALSQGDLNMEANPLWTIASTDPRRNWVRSNKNIRMNDVLNKPVSPVRFENAAGSTPGMMWAKGDVYSGGAALEESQDISAAMAKVGGQISSKSQLRNDIYKLELSDLKLPTATRTIGAGRYVVSNKTVNLNFTYEVDDVEYTQTVPITYRTLSYFDANNVAQKTWFEQRDVDQIRAFAQAAADEGDADNFSVDVPVVPGATAVSNGKVEINGAGNGFEFDFSTDTFRLTKPDRYNVEGNIEIGYEDAGEEGQQRSVELAFPSGTNSAALNVTGSVNIKGQVLGKAGIAAEGDVSLSVPTVDIEADPNLPIVIYGKRNVNITASDTKSETSSPALKLRGLIYAGKSVNMNSSKAVAAAEFNGSIVAQDGDIRMAMVPPTGQQSSNVKFTFDPKYLDAFTQGLPGNRRRLRQATYFSY
jgi:hypothetical protein